MNFLNTQITLIKSVDLLAVKILLLLHGGNPFRIIKYLETLHVSLRWKGCEINTNRKE